MLTTRTIRTMLTMLTYHYYSAYYPYLFIEARDEHSNPRGAGGDRFNAAIVKSDSFLICDIDDRGDGTYEVSCPDWPTGLTSGLHLLWRHLLVRSGPGELPDRPGGALLDQHRR